MNRPSIWLVLCVLMVSFGSGTSADEVRKEVRGFLNRYCSDCHGPGDAEADFRIDQLRISTNVTDAEYWQLVLDNLNLGEMPPEEATEPSSDEVEQVTEWIVEELRRARHALMDDSGETVLRRLNRTEYEYTMEDLFDVRGDFTSSFPEDATHDGFDNNGAALMLSAAQIEAYVQAADFVLDRAIQTEPRPKTKTATFTLHDFNREAWNRHKEQLERRQRDFDKLTPDEQKRTKDMLEELTTNPHAGFGFPVLEDGRLRVPTPEDDEQVDAVIAIQAGYAAPDTRRVFSVRYPGWYRFRITAYAASNEGAPVRLRISYGSFRQGTIPDVAGVISLSESSPKDFEYRLYLQPNEIIKMEMIDGENWAPRDELIHLPGPFVAIRAMEMEGPLLEQWPPRGHQALLGTRDAKTLTDDDMPSVLSELAPRLFRRPVADAAVQDYLAFYRAAKEQDATTLDAFKLTTKSMLTSPQFLYHLEPGEEPDSYAIANRLSYFLWRSIPDDELMSLAATGEIARPDVLKGQVDRMLGDPRSERFLRDFAGQWLGINRVGEMQPDGNLYPEYDAELERSMVGETESFVREMLQHDLSIDNFIDSDWAMLNDRMAKHYGIPGVEGSEFRRVRLDRHETVRGGLLTQASILNITSNGTTTSPVVRGVWILERLLGTPAPPPPPDVPPIEPDIRGASTIQEQLERHRSIEQCANCHRKIDPYGFALEGFDVIGGWRDRYRALEPTANPNRPQLVQGAGVVCSDRLPRLGEFSDFAEFRELLKQERLLVYKNVARQLATFALGRTMDFADEQDLQTVVSVTLEQGGGLKTMIRELAAHEIFRRR